MEIIGASLLASMALATQLLHDVRMPHGQVRPTVLSQLVIAESGDRKSTVQHLALRPYYDFDAQSSRDGEDRAACDSERRIWRRKCQKLENTISHLEDQDTDAQSERSRLRQLLASKPMPDRSPRLIFENMTPTSLYEALQGDERSIVILSDEADSVFRSPLFTASGLLNKGWDASDTMTLDRANREAIISRRPRVSSFLLIQPDVWIKMYSKRGHNLRASGYFARMLPVLANSTQGYRMPSPETPSWLHLDAFHKKVREKLNLYESQLRSTTGPQRTSLLFNSEAKSLLLHISQNIEQRIAPGMQLHEFRDFASKAVENICRVAASLHCFSVYSGNIIDEESVARAADIVDWHGEQFELIFASHGPLSPLANKAATLLRFLQTHYWNCNKLAPLSEAFRTGPIRPRESFDACLCLLTTRQRVLLVRDPTATKVLIAPALANTAFLI